MLIENTNKNYWAKFLETCTIIILVRGWFPFGIKYKLVEETIHADIVDKFKISIFGY